MGDLRSRGVSVEDGHFRGAPRTRAECRVEVKRLGGDGSPFVAYTSDIGLGGLCLSHCGALGVGDRVEVALSCPSCWEPVVLCAEVTWRKPVAGGDETGFRFVDTTESMLSALSALVSALGFEN
jgi:hypothetical protein